MGHREQAGTEGPKQTPTVKVGDTEGCQGLEGTPCPLHTERGRTGRSCAQRVVWMCVTEWAGVLSGKNLNVAHWVCDSLGCGQLHLENGVLEFPGCQGLQVPMLVSLSRSVLNSHQALP